MFDPFYKNQALLVKAIFTLTRKYPRHRTNLGMLRFRTEGDNILSKYRVSDGVWTVNAQFMVNNKRRSGGVEPIRCYSEPYQ